MTVQTDIAADLAHQFGESAFQIQPAADGIPTFWVGRDQIHAIASYLKNEAEQPYRMLYDLTAIDERTRSNRPGQPESVFTAVYHLLSFDRNEDIRLKVALDESSLKLPSVTDIWESANWLECEVWDMFGIAFEGHPHLRRILMPPTWKGHPLRKDHPARATEMGPFQLPDEKQDAEQEALLFRPEEWGMKKSSDTSDFMFLNLGPQHPGTHGVLRVILQLDGEEIVDCVPDIGYHHRGAEKMGERQSWHSYIPYTDRIDYLGGVMNNLPYVMAVEKLAGIQVPERVETIRVMMCELFRIASHLVWYGTFAQDIGIMSPVFYTFNDRERIFDIVKAICGGRMHPSWFRIGGVAHDLPQGWDKMILDFVRHLPARIAEWDKMVMQNRLFKARTQGIGVLTRDECIDWGATGPFLRACGYEWDFRKKRPYSGYDRFEFDIPTAERGDCYDRGVVRIAEMYQSLRIIEQCVKNMPSGSYKADHPLTTPPLKEKTMYDIETLINHFLGVSWGPVIPPGEAFSGVEASKGNNGYYLVSDGSTMSYRTRIRTPSFRHLQLLPLMSRGHTVADILAVIGSIDFVLADVDR
jgi:NADH-quinone oxidoreductase subunit C/D